MYCLDELNIHEVRGDIDRVLNDDQSGRYFGVPGILRDIITPKVRALLASTHETTSRPSVFNFLVICAKCGMQVRPSLTRD
jgi:hypothetical protein